MKTYRAQAEVMLERWGIEVAEGNGQPNILATFGNISEGKGGGGDCGAMFSPLAEKAEFIMQDVRRVDPHMYGLLVLRALGLNTAEMVKTSGIKRHLLERQLDEALGAFQGILYSRNRVRYWGA